MTTDEMTAIAKLDSKLDLLIERQTKIAVVLFDTDGNKGLASKVGDVCEKVEKNTTQITRLWIAFLVLGSVAFGIDKLMGLIKGG